MGFPPGDILVFMTGQEDIEATCQVGNVESVHYHVLNGYASMLCNVLVTHACLSHLFLEWYDMIRYDKIWYDVLWYDIIRYDMIWYDMIRYDVIW